MPLVEAEFEKLTTLLTNEDGVAAGQLFGKACLKVHGKAFLARQNDVIVFKLNGASHAKAIGLDAASLWDPSGKGRPMKEWVALPMEHRKVFASLAKEALKYVAGAA